jgi:galactoside O-acetyltransferase
MSSFYSNEELLELGFKNLGKEVKISKKASLYGISRMEVGDFSRIDDFCVISAGDGGIIIGKFVHIACHVSIIGKEKIQLKDFVGVSSHSSIYSSSDDYTGGALTNPTIFIEKYRDVDNRPVTLEKHALIGAHSCILPGVTIGQGTAIGAHSLVVKDVIPMVVATGVPCRPVKPRFDDLLELEKLFLKDAGY